MSSYFPPEFNATRFTCPHCDVLASQSWNTMYTHTSGNAADDSWRRCLCFHCGGKSFWFDGRLIIPADAPVESMHVDLPEICRADYQEARDIVARSPRAAAALIRLTLQKLMPLLGEKGENINDDIRSLVGRGLPIEVQQALDYCRVVGNNAVHPGEIELNDTPEIAHSLFSMINFIVEDRISRPKRVAGLYGKLPEGALEAIRKRDALKAKS